jgi:hypothetical protein
MPRRKGSQNKLTVQIKDAVEHAFSRANKGGRYLDELAVNDPKTFCSLVSRCIPAQATLAISHHIIDLHLAIKDADERLQLIGDSSEAITQNVQKKMPTIDVTPNLLITNDTE